MRPKLNLIANAKWVGKQIPAAMRNTLVKKLIKKQLKTEEEFKLRRRSDRTAITPDSHRARYA